MNYRHIYHAGNFADIVKHLVLIAILEQLKNKEAPFAVLDAFAGVGLYDLSSIAASKTLEYNNGISKLLKLKDSTPKLLQTFLNIMDIAGESHYPGSPFIITKLLRPQDRLIACEMHPEDYLSLKKLLSNNIYSEKMKNRYTKINLEKSNRSVSRGAERTEVREQPRTYINDVANFGGSSSIQHIDAYNAIKAFLPFQEKRGLIFLDPPFEVKNEFQKLLTAFKQIKSSALNNSTLIWYPIKDLFLVRDFYHNYKNIGFKETLIIEYELLYSDKNMIKCGLMVINPPNIRKDLEELTEYLSSALNLKFTYIDL